MLYRHSPETIRQRVRGDKAVEKGYEVGLTCKCMWGVYNTFHGRL